jgi:hypothetical protein
MRRVRPIVALVLLPTLALAIAAAVAPQRAALEVHIWLVVVLGLGLLVLVATVRAAYPTGPSPFVASLRRPALTVERPAGLVRLERAVSMAGNASFDVHFRLRPPLAELATELLAARRGIALEREPERARAALGEDAWELVRPDRPQPPERHAPGLDASELDRVVTALEQL